MQVVTSGVDVRELLEIGYIEVEDVFIERPGRLRRVLQVHGNVIIYFERTSRSVPLDLEGVDCSESLILSDLNQSRAMVKVIVFDVHELSLFHIAMG